MLKIGLLAVILAASFALSGCSADCPSNPWFPLTVAAARAELAQMQESPRPASRPIIIIGGYADPGIIVSQLAAKLRRVLADETPIITVAPGWTWTMEDARRRLLDKVEQELARTGQDLSIDVDVVGYSMGGLVARCAAMPDADDPRRLNIVRLMTIATPHQGADWAQLPTLEDRVVDMRAGSAFLCALDEDEQCYELLPYCRLNDWIVGCANAAPPGRTAWWVPNQPLQFGHIDAHKDPRILADIARRLRGEEPFTTLPAADLPN